MANVRSANTFYVDSTGTLTARPSKLQYAIVTATAASAIVALTDTDGTTDRAKFNLRVATSGESRVFDFSTAPVTFPNGIKVTTLTNALVTLVFTEG